MNIATTLLFLQLLYHAAPDSSWMKQYDIIRPSGGLFIVKKFHYDTINTMRIEKKWKAGILNKKGKVILPLDYDDVGLFSEGLAEIVKESTCSSCWGNGECSSFYYEGDHGYVDEKGEIIIPLRYSAVGEFHEGLAWVAIERSDGDIIWMFINKSGERVFNFTFNEGHRFHSGVAPVMYIIKEKEYYNYIDHAGKLLIPLTYSFLEPYRAHSLRAFKRGSLYGFLDSNGVEKIKPTYALVDIQRKHNWQYLRLVGCNNKLGYIDERNGCVTIPIIYDSLFLADKNLLWAKRENKWGLINKINETIIPFRFDQVEPFYEHLASVSIDRKYGYIDTLGNFKIKPVGCISNCRLTWLA